MNMKKYCKSLTCYQRRATSQVKIAQHTIGAGSPVAVQTMTNTSTLDTAASVEQIERIANHGGRIIRLTTQGEREALNLANIAAQAKAAHPDVALVADVHFVPQVAEVAATTADKVRINPGNYNDRGGHFKQLIELCRQRGVALRIGVNHGSLAKKIFTLYGDTPEGMAASAMEFLEAANKLDFHNVVVSLKSSNVRVMVYAYRLLVEAMDQANLHYPIHLGVTEAGNLIEGRVKSAVGIGALLADGIGDTIRVSLTEAPENEIPAAQTLVDHFALRGPQPHFEPIDESRISSFAYDARKQQPVLWSELSEQQRAEYRIVEATSEYPVQEWRSKILAPEAANDPRPIMLRRTYHASSLDNLAIAAAADLGVMFIDSLADGIDLRCEGFSPSQTDEISLLILQAARVRFSRTEYIACPSCGRTLYDIESTLAKIKARTNHLVGLKIGVMGCIVNGPGEMADADYGYVGGLPDHISLYRGQQVVERNIPQEQAIDRLIELIKADGRWTDPQ